MNGSFISDPKNWRFAPVNPARVVLHAGAICLVLCGCDTKPQGASPPAPVAEIQGELIQPAPPTNPVPPLQVVVAKEESTPAVAAAPVQAPTPEGREADAFDRVGFDKLSAFNFEVSDEILQSNPTNATLVASRTADQIPKAVKAFDQKRIALKGFMLPLKVEGGKVTEMLIMRDQSMCCYGSVPKINEWVSVRMVGGGVRPIMDQAITLYGKLRVGEMRENGYLVGIYQMDGERIEGPTEN